MRSKSVFRTGAWFVTSSPNITISGTPARRTSSAASGSNQRLNSAAGVTFPGTRAAPPMKTRRLTRGARSGRARNTCARLVMGPTATRVTSSGRLSTASMMNDAASAGRGRTAAKRPPCGGRTSGPSSKAPLNEIGPHRASCRAARSGVLTRGARAPRCSGASAPASTSSSRCSMCSAPCGTVWLPATTVTPSTSTRSGRRRSIARAAASSLKTAESVSKMIVSGSETDIDSHPRRIGHHRPHPTRVRLRTGH